MDYIPRATAPARDWMVNFAAKLSDEPERYLLLPADAASIQGAVDAFVDAYLLCVDRDTRTSSRVLMKDQKRAQAEQICRYWAMRIKANSGVSDADKNGLGLHINHADPRARIPAPTSWPLLNVLANAGGGQLLRYTDSVSGGTRKPRGVIQLQLYCAITDSLHATLEEARFIGNFTRNPIVVPFKRAQDRKTATYFARWSTRTAVGPWCNPQRLTIAV